jgi:hypothetical protein
LQHLLGLLCQFFAGRSAPVRPWLCHTLKRSKHPCGFGWTAVENGFAGPSRAFLGAFKASPTPGLAFLADVEFVERVIKDLDLIAHWHAVQQSFGIPACAPASCFGVVLAGGHWPDSLSGPGFDLGHHRWRWLGCSCNGFFCLAFGDVVRVITAERVNGLASTWRLLIL